MVCPQEWSTAKEPDPGAEVPRIGGDLQQSFGGGPKQQIVDDPFVLKRQRGELFRQSEHDVEVFHRQQLLGAGLHPLSSGCSLTLRAVAIPTTIVCDLGIAALIAPFEVAAQGRSATGHNVLHHAPLCRWQCGHKSSIQAPENISHFQFRSGHCFGSRVRLVGRRSKGLVVCRSARLETWR
jgi:hypothetical protein